MYKTATVRLLLLINSKGRKTTNAFKVVIKVRAVIIKIKNKLRISTKQLILKQANKINKLW